MPSISSSIPATTRMGRVTLTVADLERSVAYYRRAIGLGVLERSGDRASLGTEDTELLVLEEHPGASSACGCTGLYHFALRVPDRPSLARWLAHAARERVPLVGMSDHFVSEAIYLSDPDQHGIELYADRPRGLWEGQIGRMTTLPLDVEDLFGELDDTAGAIFDGLPRGTEMGHVHLRVARLPATIEFYRDVLGFDLTAAIPQAAFLGAGGYHHHIGANTWESLGAPPPPPGSAALRHATIVVESADERDRVVDRVADSGQAPEPHPDGPLVRDPSGNALLLATT